MAQIDLAVSPRLYDSPESLFGMNQKGCARDSYLQAATVVKGQREVAIKDAERVQKTSIP